MNLDCVVPKHGRNRTKHINKAKAALKKAGGVVSGNVRKARKPREVELPLLLAADKRCKMPSRKGLTTAWVDANVTPEELESLMTRIADKQAKAFSCL